ncbi:HAMP domain-containing sensor histidine kinase [Bacillus sp. DX1.1]|uniref:sensor histidine kinase n=1 Tax=unclassified Bacillus (in: firmicutes) TaxID=185979 RepID=UPI00256FE6DA|nr:MULTISPECIES: HAMP domain-containing sensor histidine kinase [unclassified Bacillus (in: firmicutes)]MDM5154389.1 HAMP domain-containing sensor histidine kinase [Bacillus sp. DX1.1]WJE83295.1 HAMP domain-containing sensor histidine kinase [Bacillus sp. DX3.1]
MRKSTSLLRRYLLIIFVALILLPLIVPLSSFFLTNSLERIEDLDPYYGTEQIEEKWANQAKALHEENPEEIEKALQLFREQYPEGSMFWIDGQGQTRFQIPEKQNIPQHWSASDTVAFMKKSFEGDPFTVVSYMGKKKQGAFMVFQIPRKYLKAPIVQIRERYEVVFELVIITFFAIFIVCSIIFFLKIRKRLLKLQKAMEFPKDQSIPLAVQISKKDEVGLLEESFNKMVEALHKSRMKGEEEEQFRRKLIADLSHDLRTPLTAMRAQIDSLKEEVISAKGNETIELIDEKINYLAELIENLLSYSLITAKKYPYHPEPTDMTRLTRKLVASWYDMLDEQGFEVDIVIPEKPLFWNIDANWFQRIIDNVIQNVIRHAKDGRFIGIYINHEEETIIVVDHGPGFQNAPSVNKGAGIGLSIIAVMAKEMEIEWRIDSDDTGAKILFKKLV